MGHEGVHDIRCEMGAPIFHDDLHRLQVRKGVFVGALGGQGVVDVSYGDNPR